MTKNSSQVTAPADQGIICDGCESYVETFWQEDGLTLCEFCRA